MYLLKSPIRPLRRNVVRHNLHADVPLAGGTDEAAKTVVPKDVRVEHASPEPALSIQIGGVEHDHLAYHVHGPERS